MVKACYSKMFIELNTVAGFEHQLDNIMTGNNGYGEGSCYFINIILTCIQCRS